MAQALLLARADLLYRPMAETLSRLASEHHLLLVATTLAPLFTVRPSLRTYGAGASQAHQRSYVPEGSRVYNAALIFGPDGTLLGRVNKVFLTHPESETASPHRR